MGARGAVSFFEKNLLMNEIASNFIEVLKMTKIETTTSARSITVLK